MLCSLMLDAEYRQAEECEDEDESCYMEKEDGRPPRSFNLALDGHYETRPRATSANSGLAKGSRGYDFFTSFENASGMP